eukprot:gnl/MRDRNA2_/MRDRNA2_93179_c0_seq1.p1 gnl/MRDRNA2_/MRDRNA2_93179_c0~~gnl/MRDRNA2_/MRDRNA2_93179_c0_seq1.p1  ORF type:complete len:483 (-),score=62.44 gnl/MRDRNA2_/MRDRNA2_93179_c0_seq1:54-1502(-)
MANAQSEVALIIEKLGFGWAQISQLLVGGGIWAADAAELLIIGSITRAMSKEWDISANERGAAASIIYVGIGMGNMISGPMGDRWGRKPMIVSSFIGIAVFSCLSAAAVSFKQVLFCRALVGTSIGLGQPSWNALGNEMTPKKWQGDMIMFAQCFFSIGECFAVALLYLDDPSMKHLSWRKLLVEAASPSVVMFIVAYFLLKESPRFLAVLGDRERAMNTLRWMRQANRKMEVELNLPASQEVASDANRWSSSFYGPLQTVLGRWLLPTTVLYGFSAFVLNFMFYGGLYAFPQVLPTLKMDSSPVMILMIGICTELPGNVLGARLVNYLSKRTCIGLYICICILGHLPYAILIDGSSAGLLPAANDGKVSALTEALLVIGMVIAKVAGAAGWITIYTLVSQAYPTASRTTGSAVCISCGRLGSIAAPIVYELLLSLSGHAQRYFILIAAICFINLCLVFIIDPIDKDTEEVSRLRDSCACCL